MRWEWEMGRGKGRNSEEDDETEDGTMNVHFPEKCLISHRLLTGGDSDDPGRSRIDTSEQRDGWLTEES